MRRAQYLTMFDAFQGRYHSVVVTLLYLAAIAGDVLWSASILAALGENDAHVPLNLQLDALLFSVLPYQNEMAPPTWRACCS